MARALGSGRGEMIDNPLNRLACKRGSQLPWAKLDEAKVSEILALIERRDELKAELREMTNAAIAQRYGVHTKTIDKVVSGVSWGHVWAI